MSAPEVGRRIAWREVPDRALVAVETQGGRLYALRSGSRGHYVGGPASWVGEDEEPSWSWFHGSTDGDPLVVALSVPAQASADHLRGLAKVFEVREAASDEFKNHLRFRHPSVNLHDLTPSTVPGSWDVGTPCLGGERCTHAFRGALGGCDGSVLRSIYFAQPSRGKDGRFLRPFREWERWRDAWRPGMSAEDAARLLAERA